MVVFGSKRQDVSVAARQGGVSLVSPAKAQDILVSMAHQMGGLVDHFLHHRTDAATMQGLVQ